MHSETGDQSSSMAVVECVDQPSSANQALAAVAGSGGESGDTVVGADLLFFPTVMLIRVPWGHSNSNLWVQPGPFSRLQIIVEHLRMSC